MKAFKLPKKFVDMSEEDFESILPHIKGVFVSEEYNENLMILWHLEKELETLAAQNKGEISKQAFINLSAEAWEEVQKYEYDIYGKKISEERAN